MPASPHFITRAVDVIMVLDVETSKNCIISNILVLSDIICHV
jgi:hypothetical protein